MIDFAIAASETHNAIHIADMGEGALILIEVDDEGFVIGDSALSFDQLEAAYKALARRYAAAPPLALAA